MIDPALGMQIIGSRGTMQPTIAYLSLPGTSQNSQPIDNNDPISATRIRREMAGNAEIQDKLNGVPLTKGGMRQRLKATSLSGG